METRPSHLRQTYRVGERFRKIGAGGPSLLSRRMASVIMGLGRESACRWRRFRFEELTFASVGSASEEVNDGTNEVKENYNQDPNDLITAGRLILDAINDHPNPKGEKEDAKDAHATREKEVEEGNGLQGGEGVGYGLHVVILCRCVSLRQAPGECVANHFSTQAGALTSAPFACNALRLRALSSVGQSTSFTPRGSKVRVL